MNLLFKELPTQTERPFLAVPESVIFTPDKNRTWAQTLGLSAMDGHTKGRDVIEQILQACYDAGALHVGVWMMSESNRRKRPQYETDGLKHMLKEKIVESWTREEPVNIYICGDLRTLMDQELEDLVAARHA